MDLYERLLAERDEDERSRGRPSSWSEDTASVIFGGGPGSTFEARSRDQRRTDLRQMKSYFRYGVHSRFEAMHLAHLRRRYPDQFWDLRYGRL